MILKLHALFCFSLDISCDFVKRDQLIMLVRFDREYKFEIDLLSMFSMKTYTRCKGIKGLEVVLTKK